MLDIVSPRLSSSFKLRKGRREGRLEEKRQSTYASKFETTATGLHKSHDALMVCIQPFVKHIFYVYST